jgi:hypothetical protein
MNDKELIDFITELNLFVTEQSEVKKSDRSIEGRPKLISKLQSLWIGKILYRKSSIL